MPACAKTSYAAILLSSFAVSQIANASELELRADRPVVSVETRSAGRNFIRLPSIDYQFSIHAVCAESMKPRSLSLSIADTRIFLDNTDLDSRLPLSVSVRIPADQIAPVALDEFCAIADDGPKSRRVIEISGILSAQASLRCENEDSSEVVYASSALDVSLQCHESRTDEELPPAASARSR